MSKNKRYLLNLIIIVALLYLPMSTGAQPAASQSTDVIATTKSRNNLADGLVAYYSFDDGTATDC